MAIYAMVSIHKSKYARTASSFELFMTVVFFPILIIGALALSVIGLMMEVYNKWMS
jgi:hypothetical protein